MRGSVKDEGDDLKTEYESWIWFGLMAAVAIILISIVYAEIVTESNPPYGACYGWNGKITPYPELCKYACGYSGSDYEMQVESEEVCNCCNEAHIDYSAAGEYQERVYVVNPDGSQGQDITCDYYPNASGC